VFIGVVDFGMFVLFNGWVNLEFVNDFGLFVVIVSVIGLGWFVILLYVDVVVLLVDIGLIYMMMMLCIFYVMVCNGNVLEFLVCINCSGVLWVF